jgi:hypothetical protein
MSCTALCLLYGPLSLQWPFVPSTALGLCYGSTTSTALYLTHGPLPHSTALCPLNGPLSSIRPSISSTALCPLYGPRSLYGFLYPVRPSVLFTAICLLTGPLQLYGPLSSLRSSVLATALCPRYCPLSSLRPSSPSTRHVFLTFHKMMMVFCWFAKQVSPKRAVRNK